MRNGSEQLLASKYRLVLAREKALRLQLRRDREAIKEHTHLNNEGDTP